MVSHCHELGKGWVPEDGIVWQANVGDVEVNEPGAVVVALPKDDRSSSLPEAVPKKKKASPGPNPHEAGTSGGIALGSAPVQGAPPSIA